MHDYMIKLNLRYENQMGKYFSPYLKLVFLSAPYRFIETVLGNTLLMVNNYTYTQNNRSKRCYYCSRRACRSRVKLNEDGMIVLLKEDHDHPPPVYSVVRGKYYRIRNGTFKKTRLSHGYSRPYSYD